MSADDPRLEALLSRYGDAELASKDELLQLESLAKIDGLSAQERTVVLSGLVNKLVTLSRHHEALAYGGQLVRVMGIVYPSRIKVWVVSRLAAVRHPRLRGICLRVIRWLIRKPRKVAEFSAVRAVQFAFFWHDIRRCIGLAAIQLSLARTVAEVNLATSWLGYSHAYAASRKIGIRLLRGALASMHQAGDDSALAQTYPILGIAYQMLHQPRRAEHYHRIFLDRYSRSVPFFRLLTITNMQAVSFARCDFSALRRFIDLGFNECFGLDSSRHHLQTNGWHAVLLAAEGQNEPAEQSLAVAQRAAERSNNHLDWSIFCRIAAHAYLQMNRINDAERMVFEGEGWSAAYGASRFYEREFAFLRAFLVLLRGGTVKEPHFLARATRLFRESARYACERVGRTPSVETTFKALGARLSETLSSSFGFDPEEQIGPQQLEDTLKQTFSSRYVASAPDLQALSEKALADLGDESLRVAADDTHELRLVTRHGLFVGAPCPTTVEVQEPLAVGVLLTHLDIVSETLTKAAFRMLLGQFVFVRSIRVSRKQYAAEKRVAAIGRLSRMLAHDVRQPFAMLRVAVDTLKQAETPAEFKEMASEFLRDMEHSTRAVDALIADVLEVESKRAVQTEPTSCVSILTMALTQVVQASSPVNLTFSYSLEHQRSILVDTTKMLRVLVNIITNAVEAMRGEGRLWFRCCDTVVGDTGLGDTVVGDTVVGDSAQGRKPYVELYVGNNGPRIPSADVADIFDPLYTRGKPRGTGLGLAIAQKIVADHGGVLWCDPDAAEGVEFGIRIPAGPLETLRELGGQLPVNSRQIQQHHAHRSSSMPPPAEEAGSGIDRVVLREQIRRHLDALPGPLTVVIVDDEPLYRRWLEEQLRGDPEIADAIQAHPVGSVAECMALPHLLDADFVIVDVDLAEDQNGLDLVRQLRAAGSCALVAMHSNRVLPEDFREAASAGADACIPKPMSQAQLQRLVIQAASHRERR